MYARPTIGGQVSTLGVSGMLWRDALIMYDRATKSLWSQINGQAVAGPMKGKKLEELPSELTTWGAWKGKHPDTLVLAEPPLSGSPYEHYFGDSERIGVLGSTNPDPRLGGKTLVFGLEWSGRFAAVPLTAVETRRIVNAAALGVPILITTSSAFDRRVDRRVLTFDGVDVAHMLDRETGSTWSIDNGEAIGGPLRGRQLRRISSKVVYWGVWARFHPRSEVIR